MDNMHKRLSGTVINKLQPVSSKPPADPKQVQQINMQDSSKSSHMEKKSVLKSPKHSNAISKQSAIKQKQATGSSAVNKPLLSSTKQVVEVKRSIDSPKRLVSPKDPNRSLPQSMFHVDLPSEHSHGDGYQAKDKSAIKSISALCECYHAFVTSWSTFQETDTNLREMLHDQLQGTSHSDLDTTVYDVYNNVVNNSSKGRQCLLDAQAIEAILQGFDPGGANNNDKSQVCLQVLLLLLKLQYQYHRLCEDALSQSIAALLTACSSKPNNNDLILLLQNTGLLTLVQTHPDLLDSSGKNSPSLDAPKPAIKQLFKGGSLFSLFGKSKHVSDDAGKSAFYVAIQPDTVNVPIVGPLVNLDQNEPCLGDRQSVSLDLTNSTLFDVHPSPESSVLDRRDHVDDDDSDISLMLLSGEDDPAATPVPEINTHLASEEELESVINFLSCSMAMSRPHSSCGSSSSNRNSPQMHSIPENKITRHLAQNPNFPGETSNQCQSHLLVGDYSKGPAVLSHNNQNTGQMLGDHVQGLGGHVFLDPHGQPMAYGPGQQQMLLHPGLVGPYGAGLHNVPIGVVPPPPPPVMYHSFSGVMPPYTDDKTTAAASMTVKDTMDTLQIPPSRSHMHRRSEGSIDLQQFNQAGRNTWPHQHRASLPAGPLMGQSGQTEQVDHTGNMGYAGHPISDMSVRPGGYLGGPGSMMWQWPPDHAGAKMMHTWPQTASSSVAATAGGSDAIGSSLSGQHDSSDLSDDSSSGDQFFAVGRDLVHVIDSKDQSSDEDVQQRHAQTGSDAGCHANMCAAGIGREHRPRSLENLLDAQSMSSWPVKHPWSRSALVMNEIPESPNYPSTRSHKPLQMHFSDPMSSRHVWTGPDGPGQSGNQSKPQHNSKTFNPVP